MKNLRHLREKVVVRYLLVGGTSFAIEMSCLLGLHFFLHLSVPLATSIAYWVGLVLAFSLQKVVAFQDKRFQLGILTWQALLFGVLTLFNWWFAVFFVGLFSASAIVLTRPLAQLILASWNFFIYKYLIFGHVPRTA